MMVPFVTLLKIYLMSLWLKLLVSCIISKMLSTTISFAFHQSAYFLSVIWLNTHCLN